MKKSIYYHDTDTSGAVYHANYLKYLEEARSEYLAERGLSVRDLVARGIGFAIRRQEMEYKAPAVLGDTLEIKTWVKEFTLYRIIFAYTIHNQEDRLIGKAESELVCIGRDLKLIELPPEIKSQLEKEKAS